MKTYISIDVATKSLAIGIYAVSPIDKQRVADGDYVCSCIAPVLMDVFDIGGGLKVKDTSIVSKSQELKRVLQLIDRAVPPGDALVLIEYQMNANHLSNAILNMIVYHYAGVYPVEIIKPTWKNTIALHPDLTLASSLAKSSSNYRANKAHTRDNMIYLLTRIGRIDVLKKIKKANHDDIADTLCQMIAHAVGK